MICLVIGAGSESVYAINTAKKMGHYVIAFDGDSGAEGLKYADESHVADIRDDNNIYEIMGGRRPDMVIPTPVGRILVISGRVNDHYGLGGVSAAAADCCTDKYEFHKRLAGTGMRDAQCFIFRDMKQASEVRNWPMILKPRFGAGSRDIFMADDEAELARAAGALGDALAREDYILESLVQGEEYGMDGVRIDGRTLIILLRKKLLTPPPERQCVGYISVLPDDLEAGIWERLGELTDSAVRAVGIEDSIFHADILRTRDGFFMIEMSARPSGHNLHNLFTPMATGVSVISEYISFREGGRYDFKPDKIRKMMISYYDMEDRLVRAVPKSGYISEKYPVLKWECAIKAGDRLGRVPDGHSLMGRGFFVIEGKDDDELVACRNEILGEFDTEEIKQEPH